MSQDFVKYLPLSKPKIGISGKTGSWRVFAPEINYDKCIKCHICVVVCPENTIYLEDDTPRVDYDYCKGCGVCSRECPVGAINMRRER